MLNPRSFSTSMRRSASRIERLRASIQRWSSARLSDCAGSGPSRDAVRHRPRRRGRCESTKPWAGCRAFASALHRDARAPVNLTPVAGLERHLHRCQGERRPSRCARCARRCSNATARDGRHDLDDDGTDRRVRGRNRTTAPEGSSPPAVLQPAPDPRSAGLLLVARGGGPGGGLAARLRVGAAPGRASAGEPDADRRPRAAPAPAAGRRAAGPSRGARGGARTQPTRRDGMSDDVGGTRSPSTWVLRPSSTSWSRSPPTCRTAGRSPTTAS